MLSGRTEIQSNAGLLTQDPRVVARLSDERVTGANLYFPAVVPLDAHAPRHDETDVVLRVLPREWARVLRPAPAREVRTPPDADFTGQLDNRALAAIKK